MTTAIDQRETETTAACDHRDALLKEYSEVSGNFRLLTDIRFRLLAFLPLAAGASTALLSAGGGHDGASEARAFVLSLFGLLITVGLATYNDRNDQLYDALVGRAASIERQLGLSDGAFANRPTAWFVAKLLGLRWGINHRAPVTLIYSASVGLWVFSACAAGMQLLWGNHSAPRGLLVAGIVPAIALPAVAVRSIRRQRRQRATQMRMDAADAIQYVCEARRSDVATDDILGAKLAEVVKDDNFLALCSRLGGVRPGDAQARALFYSGLQGDERRRFMPDDPEELAAAHFVALISDLPAEWIYDCHRQRRTPLPSGVERLGATIVTSP